MKRLLILCFVLLLGGCPWMVPDKPSAVPDIKTRTVFVDFEAGLVTVDFCVPSKEQPPCVLCGEIMLNYSAFKSMTEVDLTAELTNAVKHAEVKSGSACIRKAR